MSDLEKASRDAVEAADNAELVRQIAAVLAAQQYLASQPQHVPVPAPRAEFNVSKWLVIGGVVVAVGLVAALFAVAMAIGGLCATACLLVLRGLWADFQKGK
ncbi:hypothetical protein GCM10018777_31570 [Streptomyces albogriseolus]|uniref:hypothetical protein n=1 Tax=Streptomyces TaxID=1883 RepID=UPI00167B1C50|nr:hypothetical protein [Streptomyces viridodiastaticus]GHG15502.1 hypothetical protein GCM10018777_31570 [Streptomyces viridodiastaticus]